MSLIVAEDLAKSYGKVIAVDGLDLRVDKDSVTGLIGPNGAGKTTTIKMILGARAIEERGALSTQLRELKKEIKREEEKLNILQKKQQHFFEQNNYLQEKIINLSMLKTVLEEGRIMLHCRNCMKYGVSFKLPSLATTEDAIINRLLADGTCIFCYKKSYYSPWDIIWELARIAWPSYAL